MPEITIPSSYRDEECLWCGWGGCLGDCLENDYGYYDIDRDYGDEDGHREKERG